MLFIEANTMLSSRKSILIILIVLFSSISLGSVNLAEENNMIDNKIVVVSDLTPISSISIGSDDDFITYGFNGTGLESDPYLIEQFNVSDGIQIEDTTKFFEIKNCLVNFISVNNIATNTCVIKDNLLSTDAFDNNAISVGLAESTLIYNNSFLNCKGDGISVHQSPNSVINGNNFSQTVSTAIKIFSSDNVSVTSNICNEGEENGGIYIAGCDYTNITKNVCRNNYGFGIRIDGTFKSLIVADNLLENNHDGLTGNFVSAYLYSTIIYNNTFRNNGFDLYGCDNVNIFNNSFFEGYASIAGCSSITIDDNRFNAESSLEIENISSENVSVTNNVFLNAGITFLDSSLAAATEYTFENNTINGKPLLLLVNDTNKTITENLYGQIIFVSCSYITIKNHIISNSGLAIQLLYCQNITVADNILSEDMGGVSVVNCINTIISNNSLYNISGSGLRLRNSEYINISNNTITDSFIGIILGTSNSSEIKYNIIANNDYGAYLFSGSSQNSIHHNNFLNNTLQASDLGFSNTWYDPVTLEGNYWSDYSGVGTYLISGSANAEDLYPLSIEVIPVITEYDFLIGFGFLFITFLAITYPMIKRRKERI